MDSTSVRLVFFLRSHIVSLQAISLDFGGTLAFERPSRATIYAEAARSRGRAVTDQEMGGMMSRVHQELPQTIDGAFRYTDPWFRRFIERIFHGLLELPAPELHGLELELFSRFSNPATYRLHPGASELPDRLRQGGLRVGVGSNWSGHLPRLLVGLELAESFDFVVSSGLEGVEKPEPAFFELLAERAGVPIGSLLHAGNDAVLDGAARAAGAQAILVDGLGRTRGDLPVVRDLEQLGDEILRLAAEG